MAAKIQSLVFAILVFTSLGESSIKHEKNEALAPEEEIESAFEEALAQEQPLLQEQKLAGIQQNSLRGIKLRSSKSSQEASPAGQLQAVLQSGSLDPQSDFEKDVMELVLGLSRSNGGQINGKDFGGVVEKIINVIENDMMPEVKRLHEVDQASVHNYSAALRVCGATKATEMLAFNKEQTEYMAKSAAHKGCRSEEASLYNEKEQAHKDRREANKEMILKCNAYAAVSAKYGEQNTNQDIVKKAASEDVETYVRRISATICGTPCAGADPYNSGGGDGGGGGEEAVPGFLQDFLIHKKACEDQTKVYNDLTIKCRNLDKAWHEKRADCNNIQEEMDTPSCKLATEIKDTCEAYMTCYLAKKTAYDTNDETVKQQEKDRKAEWKGLKRMVCIINAFKDWKVSEDEINFCKNEVHSTLHLNVTYPVLGSPDLPAEDVCTIPNLYPGTADYAIKEFDSLPAVAKGKLDKYACAISQISTTPNDGSPDTCKCERVTMNGPFSPGSLVKCTDCLDIRKSLEKNSCPIGTKVFSPRGRQDWDTFLKSALPLKDPHWIIDVTKPADGCDGCVTKGVDVPVMNSAAYGDSVSASKRWVTSDGSPWWLRSMAYTDSAGKPIPGGNYLANCYMDLSGAIAGENFPDADSVTFDDMNCDYHSKSYYCQPTDLSVTPKDGSPDGCVCKRVQLTGEYSAGALIKCEKCLDVYKSLDKNSCPAGTKIFSPQSRADWKTFLGSASPLRSPNWIIDITRPQNGCGGCTDAVMKSTVPAQATWSTSDGSPWWLRDSIYSQPNGDYEANCFMDLAGTPENENSIMFDDAACSSHSKSYYCQPVKVSATTTTTTEPPAAVPASEATSSWEKDGRTVYLFKTSPGVDVRTQTGFCTGNQLKWWSPRSNDDAQTLVTNAYAADSLPTWIQLYNVKTAPGNIGGYNVTVDDPTCVGGGSTGEWGAIRKWGCSMCDPGTYGYKSYCWDTTHAYDWFVCEALPTTTTTAGPPAPAPAPAPAVAAPAASED